MADISIRHFSGSLRDTFRRYLFTQNFIADSERPLRDAFWTALQGPEVFCREPLLGAIPSYEPTHSLRELTARNEIPKLDARLNSLPSAVFDVDRKLYAHQETSIGLVNRGRNVAVATGTGSGKTECFLLPVLDDALRSPGPGVRAIVIYPLNALANDQLGRLRAMLQPLPSITFGRYTGDTPWRREDVSASDLADVLDPNERYSREELRAQPPHILLTNFAMLEYLLLRPQDNLLFAQGRLQYVILDEAHSYSGAQGIDVALLMRRLKEAFPGRTLQFILTSATLGTDRARIARFAATLTGTDYEPDDVVLGEPVSAFALALASPVERTVYERIVPDDETMLRWYHALDSLQEMRHLVKESGLRVERVEDADTVSRLLFEWLRDNAELDSLHRLASERPRTLSEASQLLFQAEDQSAQRVVEWLVILGAHAISSKSGQPLLPGRYHLFFRGLRGGTVCLASKCSQRRAHPETVWSHLMLEDRLHCAVCEKAVLPLATCVHCGIPTVRIFELGDAWFALSPGPQATPKMLTWLDVGEEEDEPGADQLEVHLCVSCNHISGTQNSGNCCPQPDVVRLRALSTDQEGNVKECPSCGGVARPYPTVFRVFNTGEDASTAVLAEAVIRVLPADNSSKPADGRRLLAFSDSRQRAAHFAPYLARTTAQTQYLKPVYEAIRQTAKALGGDGAPFDDIAGRFVKNVVTQPFVVVRKTNDDDGEESTQIRRSTTLYAADKRDLARECLVALFANFTSSPKVRNNISGLGLAFAEVELNPEQRRELPSRLPDLFKDIDEGWALIQTLLWPMVWRKALVLPDGILSKQLTPGPEMVTFHYSEQGRIEGRQRWRWNSYLALSGRDNVVRRSQQVQALAGFLGLDAINDRVRIEATLEAVWVSFRDLDVIRQVRANEFQIPYERLLVRLADQLFACRRCGSLAARSVKRRCLVPNCGGDLDVMGATDLALRFENHHWFHRVTATSPLPLEVREHTAQLTNEAGRQYQRAFMSGDVNVLSSSTTFEMGVDVGQLKSVFLRNVPPSPSNYVQRAGRAGRRKEGAAYAVTYARSIPHDQVHYHDPLAIVQGLVPVPRINLKNTRLTQRHINSFLLGAFLRSSGVPVPVALKTMSTEWFFLGAAPVSGLFRPWLAAAGAALGSAITRIVAATGTLTPEAAFDAAAAGLDRCVAELREKLDSYRAQHAELAAELAQAQGQERVRLARAMESVERLMEQTKQESLIDFLAGSHWLPGYAFPQDVVRLLVRDPRLSDRMRLERDVEYGISEYSPGAEVIADGRLLTSRGVDLQNREMEIRYYRSCGRCNRVQEAASRAEITNLCPHCQQTAVGSGARPSAFIVPRGFTTVVDEPAAEAKIHRVIAPRASEVFLTDGASVFRSHDTVPGVTFGYRPDGGLFRANAGKRTRGFGLCSYCGRSLKQGGAHKKPWGSRCAGTVMTMVHLACRFQTDTLQLRFDGIVPPAPAVDDREFWLSFQNAFVVAAGDVLDIPSRDLGATFRSQSEGSLRGELVVYDRVPGGAGYVGEIVHELRAVLTAAFCRVDKCSNRECDPLGSCYSCLRSYENQFQWQFLRRNRVRDWLANISGGAVL